MQYRTSVCSHFTASLQQTDRQRFVPVGTCVPPLSPAELLATIIRFVELLLDKLHCSCPVLQTMTLGVTLTSYTVYVVANTEAVHVMVERRLSPVCVTSDGGHGAEKVEAEVTSKLNLSRPSMVSPSTSQIIESIRRAFNCVYL